MNISVALFGIARDIVGGPTLTLDVPAGQTADGLLADLRARYPALAGLRSLALAVNSEYAAPGQPLAEHDELALIPPVSGG